MKRLTPQEFYKEWQSGDANSPQRFCFDSQNGNYAVWPDSVVDLMQQYAEHCETSEWVELDQTIRVGDCANLPLFGTDVIVEHNGKKRLDTLVRYRPDDTEGSWQSCRDFRPNVRAERWCYVPKTPNTPQNLLNR